MVQTEDYGLRITATARLSIGVTAPARSPIDRSATAATRAGRRLEAASPPPFAVDLLGAKIPIEMGCQGAMPACGGAPRRASNDARLSTGYGARP